VVDLVEEEFLIPERIPELFFCFHSGCFIMHEAEGIVKAAILFPDGIGALPEVEQCSIRPVRLEHSFPAATPGYGGRYLIFENTYRPGRIIVPVVELPGFIQAPAEKTLMGRIDIDQETGGFADGDGFT